jgi:hypothetical protein
MASITTSDVRTYVAERQSAAEVTKKAYTIGATTGRQSPFQHKRWSIEGTSNAEINRELTILKRMFTPGDAGWETAPPAAHPMLEERNTRKGFFDTRCSSGRSRTTAGAAATGIEFAYITGWRIPSEVLTLDGVRLTSTPAKCGSSLRRRRTETAACSQ